MRTDERMTIGALARESGFPVRTLRFYEEQGLIRPLGRTSKNYRVYGPGVRYSEIPTGAHVEPTVSRMFRNMGAPIPH